MNKWLKQIRVKAILPAAALLAAAAIGTTFASNPWPMTKGVENQLLSHTTDVTVQENFDPDPDDGSGPEKQARFTNTGTSSIFLRVSYTDYWENEGNILSNTDAAGMSYAKPKIKNTDEYWFDGGDGWYYYRRVLKTGESTELFVDGVDFAPKTAGGPSVDGLAEVLPIGYETEYYHLYFKAEAVQCSDGPNTANPDEVNEHATEQVFHMVAAVRKDTNKDVVKDEQGRAYVDWQKPGTAEP